MTDHSFPLALFAVQEQELVSLPTSATSVHGMFEAFPLGAYEALRTYAHDRFLGLDEHLARLQSSCKQLQLEPTCGEARLRQALQQVAEEAPPGDSRLRFDVLGGPLPPELGTDSRVLIGRAPLPPLDPKLLEEGVAVELERQLQRVDPEVKDAAWVIERKPRPLGQPEAFEHLLLDPQGRLLEGTSSNLFLIRNGVLYTAQEGVLLGVTRKLVLELAKDLVMAVRLMALWEEDIDSLDEAFLTSSSRHIVPVVSIDGRQVGNGQPGPWTQHLAAHYEDMVERRAVRAYSPPPADRS